MEIVREINPQPHLPIISFFRSEEEDYEDYVGWCYQSPEEVVPGLVFNAQYIFKDPDQPGKKGERFEGKIIERVLIRIVDNAACWVIITAEIEPTQG